MSDASWEKIFLDYDILSHDFDYAPFKLTAKDIKKSCQDFEKTAEKEVRLLCKQDSRESVPSVMANNGLFLLPTRNGEYALIKGEGYFDIPEIMQKPQEYNSKIPFELETSKVGNSEMQHLDLAYASSVIRTFLMMTVWCLLYEVGNTHQNFRSGSIAIRLPQKVFRLK